MQLTKHEVGSPVDMAKSYMQARPPWASSTLRRSGSRTPSPMAIDIFKDETPFSVGGNLSSSAQVLFGLLLLDDRLTFNCLSYSLCNKMFYGNFKF